MAMESIIGSLVGGGMGLLGGALQGFSGAKSAADLRYANRKGLSLGQANTYRQVGSILGSDEYQAGSNWIRQMFGLGPATGSDVANQLGGAFGKNDFGAYALGENHSEVAFNKAMYMKLTGGATAGGGAGVSAMPAGLGGGAAGVGNPYMLSKLYDLKDVAAQWEVDPDAVHRAVKLMKVSGKDWASMGVNDEARGNYLRNLINKKITTYEGQLPKAEAAPVSQDFSNTPNDPLTQAFVKQIRTGQMARGLYTSQAGAAAEAGGLAAFRAQMQMNLLPQLMALAENPAALTQKYETQNINKGVWQASGGGSVYGQANPLTMLAPNPFATAFNGMVQGALTGAGIGTMLGGQPQQPAGASGMTATPYNPYMVAGSMFGGGVGALMPK